MIYLHVGFPKTASSTLQRFLNSNTRVLKQHNLVYPPLFFSRQDAMGMYPGTHNALAIELRRGGPGKSWDRVRTFVEERAAGKDVVMSGEALSGCKPAELRRALGDWDVKIIYYIREFSKIFVSQYTQQTKAGVNTLDFDAFLEGKLARPASKLCDYFSTWIAAFGAENVAVRQLDSRTLAGGDVRLDILDAIGIDLAGVDAAKLEMTEDVNLAPGWKTVELLRDLNQSLEARFTKAFDKDSLEEARSSRRDRTESPLLDFTAMLAKPAIEIGHSLGFTDRGLYLSAEQFERCIEAFNAQVDALEALGMDTRLAHSDPAGFVPRQFMPSMEHVPPDEAAAFLRQIAPLGWWRLMIRRDRGKRLLDAPADDGDES